MEIIIRGNSVPQYYPKDMYQFKVRGAIIEAKNEFGGVHVIDTENQTFTFPTSPNHPISGEILILEGNEVRQTNDRTAFVALLCLAFGTLFGLMISTILLYQINNKSTMAKIREKAQCVINEDAPYVLESAESITVRFPKRKLDNGDVSEDSTVPKGTPVFDARKASLSRMLNQGSRILKGRDGRFYLDPFVIQTNGDLPHVVAELVKRSELKFNK